MELQELIDALVALMEDHSLVDEGCVVRVQDVDVIEAVWDGNTTVELVLSSE